MSSSALPVRHIYPKGDRMESEELTRTQRVMRAYGCTSEDARRYLDLRDEGHQAYQAAVLAGIADPDY